MRTNPIEEEVVMTLVVDPWHGLNEDGELSLEHPKLWPKLNAYDVILGDSSSKLEQPQLTAWLEPRLQHREPTTSSSRRCKKLTPSWMLHPAAPGSAGQRLELLLLLVEETSERRH